MRILYSNQINKNHYELEAKSSWNNENSNEIKFTSNITFEANYFHKINYNGKEYHFFISKAINENKFSCDQLFWNKALSYSANLNAIAFKNYSKELIEERMLVANMFFTQLLKDLKSKEESQETLGQFLTNQEMEKIVWEYRR